MISFGLLPILSSTGNILHESVTLNDTKKVIDILTNPKYSTIDIDSEKSDGSTSLIIASIMGYHEIVKILLSEGAYTESKSSSGATPLMFAAALNHTIITKYLLNNGADCNTKHSFASSTALHFAVEMNNVEIIEILCNNSKCNVEAEKSHGGRSIHIAAEANAEQSLITLLTKCNVDIESKLLNDTTAMYLAALNGLTNIVKILIDHGAKLDFAMPTVSRRDISINNNHNKYGSPNIPNPEYNNFHYPDKNLEIGNGATPLHAATENGHYDTAKLLLLSGSRQLGSMEGTNPLYIAIQYNQYKIAKLLLSFDASKSNINHQIPHNGHSSLYLSVSVGKLKFVKLLLSHGANINIQTTSGITPIYYSCVLKRIDILKVFLKYIVNKNDLIIYTANNDQTNVIHASAQYSCYNCINLLIDFDPLLITTLTNDNQNVLHLLLSKSRNNKGLLFKTIKKIFKICIDKNIDISTLINQESKQYGLTPFSTAIQNDIDIEIVKLLLDNGANINIAGNDKIFSATPLFMACQNNNTQLTQLLLENNADCNAKLYQRNNITPLFVAAEKGYAQIVKLLLNNCKDDLVELNQHNDDNDDDNDLRQQQHTPIHIACMNGHNEIVKIFIKHGITISIMDKRSSSTNKDSIRELTVDQVDKFCDQVHEQKVRQEKEEYKKRKKEL